MSAASPRDVGWTDVAIGDLEEVLAFVAVDDPVAAGALEERILARTNALSRHPRQGRIVPELLRWAIREYREVLVGPYRVVYRLADRRILIMAVIHGARDVEDVLFRRLARPR